MRFAVASLRPLRSFAAKNLSAHRDRSAIRNPRPNAVAAGILPAVSGGILPPVPKPNERL